MSALENGQADDLWSKARQGDSSACHQLLAKFRRRLHQMIAVRLDPRVVSGIDPIEVVQASLREAARQLPRYLQSGPAQLYPWLRSFAWQRLLDGYQRQLQEIAVSVEFEEHGSLPLPDKSAWELAGHMMPPGTSPSDEAARANLIGPVRAALATLPSRHREVLILRYLERLSMAEVAAVLGVTEGVAKLRHLRAVERLRSLIGPASAAETSPRWSGELS
jgi:RNA polymerase sigma-70 factor (ECF subfamily)